MLSDEFASVTGFVDSCDEFGNMLNVFNEFDYESLQLWNIMYVLSSGDQHRVSVEVVGEGGTEYDLRRYGGGKYVGCVVEVRVNRKISPLYSLYFLRNSVVSLVLINNILFYEYYPYLSEVFEISSKGVKVILLSATLYTYFYNLRDRIDTIASRYGVRYRIVILLNINDIYFKSMRKRVNVYEDY